MYKGIEEAVQETVALLGIEAVRKLSWFPSAGVKNGKYSYIHT
jgi:hypothetical protein